MMPLAANHPHTLLRANRAYAGARTMGKAAADCDFNGEHALHQTVRTELQKNTQEHTLSRRGTDHSVSIWECVMPDAAFAAQVIAQATPARASAVKISAYTKAPASAAKLLDRRI